MNDQDYIEIYDFLQKILQQKGLNWVVDQINEQLRLGKIESTEITPVKSTTDQRTLPGLEMITPKRTTSGRSERFLSTTEYSPQDRLLLLIDAIEQAVINTTLMVYDTLNFFGKEYQVDTIIFSDNEGHTKNLDLRACFLNRAAWE